MSSVHDLSSALSHHKMLVEDLRRRFPLEDEDTIADTVEGVSNLDAALAEVARSVEDDEAMATACKIRIEDMVARRTRHIARADAKRDAIANAMSAAGMKRVTAPDMTLSLSPGKARVIITDEAAVIADGYGKQPPAVVDKAALRAALEAKNEVKGATLGNGAPQLTIRTK